MTSKKSYSRHFIILQEDEKGYALSSDKLLSGYAKFENKNDKCKISYYVQNLKKQMEPYYLILICSKKDIKKIIKLGIMNIDDYGRMEVSYKYPIDNIANTDISIDKVIGAAVVKFVDSSIIPVMTGFSTADVPQDWLEYSVVEVNREEEKLIKEKEKIKKEEKLAEERKKVEKEKESKLEKTKKEDPKKEDSKDKDMAESEEINDKPKEKIPEEEKLDAQNVFDEYEQVIEKVKEQRKSEIKKKEDKEDIKEEKSDPMLVFFDNITRGMEQVAGVCSEIKNCKWYKVKVECMEDLYNTSDHEKYYVVYYPMIAYYPYIKNYGYYLIGCKLDSKGDMKYLVYAIPGNKSIKEQPYGGKSGFVTWVPLIPGEEDENSTGYWLMFYDPRSSVIVIPIK